MNTNEAARIAAAVNIIRPDWREDSLRTFIENPLNNLMRHPYRDALLALMYVAADPQSTTPARVKGGGPWWKVGGREDEPERASRCRCGDTHGRTAPCRTGPPAYNHQERVEALRTALRESRPVEPEPSSEEQNA